LLLSVSRRKGRHARYRRRSGKRLWFRLGESLETRTPTGSRPPDPKVAGATSPERVRSRKAMVDATTEGSGGRSVSQTGMGGETELLCRLARLPGHQVRKRRRPEGRDDPSGDPVTLRTRRTRVRSSRLTNRDRCTRGVTCAGLPGEPVVSTRNAPRSRGRHLARRDPSA
jgi:hypothetical protein